MKKTISIVVLLCIAAVGGAVWYLSRPASGAAHPDELLPENTLVMVEAVELKKGLDAFRAGPLGQAISGIDLPACMGALDAEPEAIERVSRLQAQLKAGIDSPWFDTLFGELVVFALLTPEPDDLSTPVEGRWQESAVMVLQPRKPAEMIQWIAKMFAGDVAVTEQTEGGVRMDRVETPDGPPLFVAVHRGLGLLALDPKPVVRCLAESGARNSLARNPAYAAMRAELGSGGEGAFVWIDLQRTLNLFFMLAAQAGMDDADVAQARRDWAGLLEARPVIAAKAVEDGEAVHHRIRVRYNASDLSPEAAGILGVPPSANDTFHWVPEEALYYTWQNNFDQVLASLLDLSRHDGKGAAAFRRSFVDRTGVAPDDVVGAFGSQIAFMIRDIRTGGLFPVPELALMAEVVDPAVIDRLVETAAVSFGLAMAEEGDGEGRIRYVWLPYGKDISPAYAVSQGFLVVASSRGLLKSLLSRGDGWQPLMDSQPFRAVVKRFSDPANQMTFLRSGQAAKKAGDLIRWGLSLAVMTGKAEEARQMIYIANKVAAPILEGLSTYPAVGSRTVIQEDGIQTDVHVLNPRQP